MKNYSIRTKLLFSFSLLILFVIGISGISIYFVREVGDNVEEIYNHPYTVTNAVRKIEIAAFEETNLVYPLSYDDTLETSQIKIDMINMNEETIEQFAIIEEYYLGDITDVREVENSYELIYSKLLLAIEAYDNGLYTEAKDYINDIQVDYFEVLIVDATIVKDFADNKAIEFREEAARTVEIFVVVIITVSITMSLLGISVFLFMVRDIFPPIKKLLNTIGSFEKGENLNTLDMNRNDEIGNVSVSLNKMLDNIKTQNEIEALDLKLSSLRDRENLRITLMSIGDGVITTNLNGEITNINKVALLLIDKSLEECLGANIDTVMVIVDKTSRTPIINPVNEALKTQETVGLADNCVLLSTNGKEYDIKDSAAPIIDETGLCHGTVLVFRDVTAENKVLEEVEYLSFHDSLTGIHNRNYLERKVLELEDRRTKNIAVIMGDVNGLKISNDAFGHKFGDILLQEISSILLHSTPKERSTIVRWGGDEFVIIIEGTNQTEVENIGKVILETCKTYESASPVQPSISIGYSLKLRSDQNLYRTLIRAEDMMYENKLLEKDSLRSAIVQSLQTSLYEKSYETEEHASRVSEYCEILAREFGLPENEVSAVVLLSRLHDIGKISISDEILLKPGKLNQDEWKTIKKHPETGYRIASSLNELTHIAESILSHHEHYDGCGYPRGLKGEEIPLNARIVSIGDAFDVMLSDRSYKKGVKQDKAIEELIRCRGTQFDPQLVDLFISII